MFSHNVENILLTDLLFIQQNPNTMQKQTSYLQKQSVSQIPLEQRALIETTSQIFKKSGAFRDALLTFMAQNQEEETKQALYIDQQLQIVEEASRGASREGFEKRVSRSVTHQRKVVQISIEVQWTQDRSDFNAATSGAAAPWRLMWCIVGKDLQEIFRFLPKALNPDGSLSVPKRGSNHSRWYPMKGNYTIFKRISLELRMLQIYISSSEQIVEQRKMISSKTEDVKDMSGVLDLDIEVDTQILNDFDKSNGTHFVELIRSFKKNRGNPQKLSHGQYLYNKNGTSTDVLNQLFETTDCEIQQIPGIYEHHIDILHDFSNKEVVGKQLLEMMSGDYLVGLMSVSRHTLFWVKTCDIWYLCDPWKKRFSPGYGAQMICENIFDDVIKQINQLNQPTSDLTLAHDDDTGTVVSKSQIQWMFLPRRYNEQYKTEGSCSLAALSRVLQFAITVHRCLGASQKDEKEKKSEAQTVAQIIMSERGRECSAADAFDILINEPITDATAMLTSCMIRKAQKAQKIATKV